VLLLRDNFLVEELTGVDVEEPAVPFISDSASVSNFSNQVSNGIPRRSLNDCRQLSRNGRPRSLDLLHLVDVELEDFVSSFEVRVIEVINNVPTKSLESFAFDDKSVEPAECEQTSLVVDLVDELLRTDLLGHI